MTDRVDQECVTLFRQRFTVRHTRLLRRLVTWAARRCGVARERGEDLALAVTEAAGNAIKHGGGYGRLDLIQDDHRALIAVISDDGPGIVSQARSALPGADRDNGRGLYLIRHICDRVQWRTGPQGTTVCMEIDIRPT